MAIQNPFAKRNAPQQAAPAKPQENAKQAGTREHHEEIAGRKPIEKLPDDVKLKSRDAMAEVRELMHRATQHRGHAAGDPSAHGGTKDALVHNQSAPGKEQASLSPTDGAKGNTTSRSGSSPTPKGPSRGPSRGR